MNRQKLNSNFGTLFYEVINPPLLLMNFYLDVLARIVFNFCDKLIFPALLPDSTNYCRNSITRTPVTYFNMKISKVKTILFKQAIKLSKQLAEFSCMSVDSYFILDVFNTYKRGEDFRNQCLSIEREEKE